MRQLTTCNHGLSFDFVEYGSDSYVATATRVNDRREVEESLIGAHADSRSGTADLHFNDGLVNLSRIDLSRMRNTTVAGFLEVYPSRNKSLRLDENLRYALMKVLREFHSAFNSYDI